VKRLPTICLALAALSCRGKPAPTVDATATDSARPAFEPPVVINAESPVRYPPATFQRNVEGAVMLRLFVDSLGRLSPESTRIMEGSGVAALDSAALAGVPAMKFAPARRNGRPVASSFLQPVQFRRRERTASEGER